MTASKAPALAISHLSKTFAGQRALDDTGFTVQPGEVRALLGQNGSGKSTLIKVLAGYHAPDPGAEVEIAGAPLVFGSPKSAFELGCRFVHQDLGLLGSLSVADNLSFTGGFPTTVGTVRTRAARRSAVADLDRVGVDADPAKAVRELSAATRTGVAVARALKEVRGNAARLLVLDEPTAALTGDDVATLLDVVRRVAASGIGVLYVSHHLDEVFEIADSVTILRDGSQIAAPPVSALDHRALVTLLVGDRLDELEAATGESLTGHGPPVLEVEELSSGALIDIDLTARAGEILGIAGVDGSGRERILGAVFGGFPRSGGRIQHQQKVLPAHRPDLAVKAGIGYLPADRRAHGGFVNLSATDNIAISDLSSFWSKFRLRRARQRAVAEDWFRRLEIKPADGCSRDLLTFSGGNQQKVLLAKWLRCNPSTLLLEEPTQGVDIAAKVELHKAIVDVAERGACVVISSSDTDELAGLCHRVLVLKRGRVARELSGPELTTTALSHELLVDVVTAEVN
jgi:ribose transport system ATP-binding protein